jgi:hypothetical protein
MVFENKEWHCERALPLRQMSLGLLKEVMYSVNPSTSYLL